jgi:hypothetical protein
VRAEKSRNIRFARPLCELRGRASFFRPARPLREFGGRAPFFRLARPSEVGRHFPPRTTSVRTQRSGVILRLARPLSVVYPTSVRHLRFARPCFRQAARPRLHDTWRFARPYFRRFARPCFRQAARPRLHDTWRFARPYFRRFARPRFRHSLDFSPSFARLRSVIRSTSVR